MAALADKNPFAALAVEKKPKEKKSEKSPKEKTKGKKHSRSSKEAEKKIQSHSDNDQKASSPPMSKSPPVETKMPEPKAFVPEYQTRSETTGRDYYKRFIKAFHAYKSNRTIWKISWEDSDGTHYRWRPKTLKGTWHPQTEEKLRELCPEYAEEEDETRVFWVNQLALAPNFREIVELRLPKEEEELRMNLDCVVDMVTEEELLQRFAEQ
jgi:hypothetical protein